MLASWKNFLTPGFLQHKLNLERYLHLGRFLLKSEDKRTKAASAPKRDEGTEGEKLISMDTYSAMGRDIFPNEDLPNRLFNNVPFSQIPVCNIKVSKNNTIITLADANGEIKMLRSCGVEGFKNTRKGTNIAAQATAITFGTNALHSGFNTVRVRVRGIGPGRMSALKGLQMAGLNIVSVTDNTPVSWNPPRPRKRRRL